MGVKGTKQRPTVDEDLKFSLTFICVESSLAMPRERGQYHQIQIERTMSITVATFSEILTYDMLLLAGTQLMLPFFLH